MKYDKKIKYFDYKENGERIRNGGFVKLEQWGDTCNIFIQVSGLHAVDSYVRQIYVFADGREEKLDAIELKQGRGSLQLNRSSDNLCAGLSYEQLEAISIPITPGRELYCRIAEQAKEREQEEGGSAEQEREQLGKPEAKHAQPGESFQADNREATMECIQPGDSSQADNWEKGMQQAQLKCAEPEKLVRAGMHTDRCRAEEQEEREERVQQEELNEQEEQQEQARRRRVPLQEDKWKQLLAVYPHIAPFQDERDYLSIGPEDFVIFSQKYYGLVNNSFLLHGYYNYRHLILTCLEKRNETCYYIGVPGNFYDREKQVALMFGFESFECREEPAGAGDYGYYMIRVEI